MPFARRAIVALVLVLILCSPAWAANDEIELRNGDRISGTIVKMEGGTLVVKTVYAKEITIDWKEVVAIHSDAARRVELSSGEAVEGRFVERPDGFYLESATLAGVEPVQLDQIVSIGLPAGPVWSGYVALALGGTSGNTTTSSFGAGAEAQRDTKQDRLKFSGRTDNETRSGTTEVQSTIGRGRYDYFINHWLVTAFTELEHDRFKDLNLRSRTGGGPGYRFIKTDNMFLLGWIGAAYVNENFEKAVDRSFVSAVISEEWEWKLSEQQSIRQLLEIYPNVERASDFVAHFEAGYRQAVVGNIFGELLFINDYDNEPATGKKTNDLRYGLSVGYQF